MKCEKCGIYEANFHFKSVVNGIAVQYNLCSQCAASEGFGEFINRSPANILGSVFGDILGGGIGGEGGYVPAIRYSGMFPVLVAPTYAIPGIEIEKRVTEESEKRIPVDAGSDLRKKRELTALRHQLEAAVLAEDFEKAAELRDKIKEKE